MPQAAALKVAIDLIHVPSRVPTIRSEPLPEGVPMLLRIAVGDEDAISEAIDVTDRHRELVREAAAFFIEQILLHPGADSYRVLGGSPNATASDLRRNLALLLRWLHPDLHHQDRDQRSVFAKKVTQAWENLKTQERRAAYDRATAKIQIKKKRISRRGRTGAPNAFLTKTHTKNGNSHNRSRSSKMRFGPVPNGRPSFLRRALAFLLGGAKH